MTEPENRRRHGLVPHAGNSGVPSPTFASSLVKVCIGLNPARESVKQFDRPFREVWVHQCAGDIGIRDTQPSL